jgi:transposase
MYKYVLLFVIMTEALPNQDLHHIVPSLREPSFYETAKERSINWTAYSQAQIDDVVHTLDFIRNHVDDAEYLPMPGKVGRPLTDPKTLAKAILLAEFLGSPERPAQGWTRVLGPAVGIYTMIDDRVLGEAYNNIEVLHILKQVFEKNKTSDGRLSGDGTGLETTRKQNYETRKETGASLTSIVDSREVVQAFDASGEQECKAMHELVKVVTGKSLRLDAGFIDRELAKEIVMQGMTPFIFPKKNTQINGHSSWKKMYLSLLDDVLTWLREYHQRSHTESFHSSFKRKNAPVRKQRPIARLNQITARIILHNRRRIDYFSRHN